MDGIRRRDVILGILSTVITGICIFFGCFYRPLLFLAPVSLVLYWYLDKTRLRCPHCGGFINLDTLLYASTHPCHCRKCGEKIVIWP